MTAENRRWWLRRRCDSRLLVGLGSGEHCQAGGCRLKKSEEGGYAGVGRHHRRLGRSLSRPLCTYDTRCRSRSRPACRASLRIARREGEPER
jgi:hypothetical protein